MGYGPLIGIDISPGMLSVSGAKGIYDTLHAMPVDAHLPFPDNEFAAVISAGVLSPGQAPAQALRAFARVTKPGGYCVFSLRGGARTSPEYGDLCNQMETEGLWVKEFETGLFQVMPIAEPEGTHEIRVYRVL